ncbi:Hypothetical protein HVR_LOCUS512 [uncultured virus]|nr:Hypothetical protein HVR_LOCUS512 [uncultured virus]
MSETSDQEISDVESSSAQPETELLKISEFGFIIVRHINDQNTNKYWRESYRCVRRFYPNPILIIDDNSNPQFAEFDTKDLVNCRIVKGEFPGAGEILGYYYFHKLRPFKKAIIIHDSVFFNRYIDFSQIEGFRPIWIFKHSWDEDSSNLGFISYLENCGELVRTYLDKSKWNGCFGIMSVVEWESLNKVNNRYNFLSILTELVRNRTNRMCLERIIPLMFQTIDNKIIPPIFCDIHDYCVWGINFQDYSEGKGSHLPIIKVWTGR